MVIFILNITMHIVLIVIHLMLLKINESYSSYYLFDSPKVKLMVIKTIF